LSASENTEQISSSPTHDSHTLFATMISLGLLVQITPCEVDTIRACCFYFAFCAFSVNFMTKSFPPLIAQQLIKSEIHVQWPDKQHVPYLNAVITKDVSLL